jgi:hypothetical protein
MGYSSERALPDGRTLKADKNSGEYLVVASDGTVECSGYFYDPMPEEIKKCIEEMHMNIW